MFRVTACVFIACLGVCVCVCLAAASASASTPSSYLLYVLSCPLAHMSTNERLSNALRTSIGHESSFTTSSGRRASSSTITSRFIGSLCNESTNVNSSTICRRHHIAYWPHHKLCYGLSKEEQHARRSSKGSSRHHQGDQPAYAQDGGETRAANAYRSIQHRQYVVG